jgi:hypothetical protein
MKTFLVLLGIAIAGFTNAETASAKTVTYSIVVGNNSPPIEEPSIPQLRYADDDAIRYHQITSLLGESTLFSVLDADTQKRYPAVASITQLPSLSNIRNVVDRYRVAMHLDRKRGDSPVFYFIFNGHGARDRSGAAYFALLDGELTQAILYGDILDKLEADYSHVIVDACHAGGVVGIRGDFFANETNGQTTPVTQRDNLLVIESSEVSKRPNVGFILATSLGQESHEWSAIESGVFTHQLLSGLLGPADVNGDLNIEYTELQAFIAAANRNITNPRARSQVIAIPPAANTHAPLISLRGLRGVNVVQGRVGKLGHFFIELANGQRYLDAHLTAESMGYIVLPVRTVAYLRTANQEAVIKASAKFSELKMSAFKTAPRGSVDSSFRESLFSSPFGKSYYQGYVDSIGATGVTFPVFHDVGFRSQQDRSRKAAWVAASLSGLSATVALSTSLLAWRAKRDYDSTELQRPAFEAKTRFERNRTIAIVSGLSAVTAGAIAWYWWPTSKSTVSPMVDGNGGYSLSLQVSW